MKISRPKSVHKFESLEFFNERKKRLKNLLLLVLKRFTKNSLRISPGNFLIIIITSPLIANHNNNRHKQPVYYQISNCDLQVYLLSFVIVQTRTYVYWLIKDFVFRMFIVNKWYFGGLIVF